jgi:pSer/pThr/pTyr-binding forkhead associated (FHA) protein
MTHRLQIKDAQGEREVLLVDSLSVGRDPRCDVSAADPLLSRRHAEFVVSGPRVVVRDLGSRNGILVNGRRLPEAVLSAGDVVQIAQLVVTFVSSVDPPGQAGGETDDKTAILSANGSKQVAAASAATPASGRNANGASAEKRPAGWSVKVASQDDRTSLVPPPGPSAFDRVGPTLAATTTPLLPWLDASAEPKPAPEAPANPGDGARGAVLSIALPTLALAGVCFALGVAATVWWLWPSAANGPRALGRGLAVVTFGFVLAIGAGAVAAWAIRRSVSVGSRTETPAGGRAHLRG